MKRSSIRHVCSLPHASFRLTDNFLMVEVQAHMPLNLSRHSIFFWPLIWLLHSSPQSKIAMRPTTTGNLLTISPMVMVARLGNILLNTPSVAGSTLVSTLSLETSDAFSPSPPRLASSTSSAIFWPLYARYVRSSSSGSSASP